MWLAPTISDRRPVRQRIALLRRAPRSIRLKPSGVQPSRASRSPGPSGQSTAPSAREAGPPTHWSWRAECAIPCAPRPAFILRGEPSRVDDCGAAQGPDHFRFPDRRAPARASRLSPGAARPGRVERHRRWEGSWSRLCCWMLLVAAGRRPRAPGASRQGRQASRGRHGPVGLGAASPLAGIPRPDARSRCSASSRGRTRGRPLTTSVRQQLRRAAAKAGVRRRFAPHQLRHAHAVEMAREGVPLNVIQRQLGHANFGTTSRLLQGIDSAEIIDTIHARRAPMIPASAGLRQPR